MEVHYPDHVKRFIKTHRNVLMKLAQEENLIFVHDGNIFSLI